MLVKSAGFMRVIGLQKLLIFGAIPLVNEECLYTLCAQYH